MLEVVYLKNILKIRRDVVNNDITSNGHTNETFQEDYFERQIDSSCLLITSRHPSGRRFSFREGIGKRRRPNGSEPTSRVRGHAPRIINKFHYSKTRVCCCGGGYMLISRVATIKPIRTWTGITCTSQSIVYKDVRTHIRSNNPMYLVIVHY